MNYNPFKNQNLPLSQLEVTLHYQPIHLHIKLPAKQKHGYFCNFEHRSIKKRT